MEWQIPVKVKGDPLFLCLEGVGPFHPFLFFKRRNSLLSRAASPVSTVVPSPLTRIKGILSEENPFFSVVEDSSVVTKREDIPFIFSPLSSYYSLFLFECLLSLNFFCPFIFSIIFSQNFLGFFNGWSLSMALVISMGEVEATANSLKIDLSRIDWNSIRLPPLEDFGIKRCPN